MVAAGDTRLVVAAILPAAECLRLVEVVVDGVRLRVALRLPVVVDGVRLLAALLPVVAVMGLPRAALLPAVAVVGDNLR
jgi:hypothetical protein